MSARPIPSLVAASLPKLTKSERTQQWRKLLRCEVCQRGSARPPFMLVVVLTPGDVHCSMRGQGMTDLLLNSSLSLA